MPEKQEMLEDAEDMVLQDPRDRAKVSCFSRKWRDTPPELYYNSAGVLGCSPFFGPR